MEYIKKNEKKYDRTLESYSKHLNSVKLSDSVFEKKAGNIIFFQPDIRILIV